MRRMLQKALQARATDQGVKVRRLPRRMATRHIVELTGLSRHQVYRMKRRLGWGRFVYLRQLVDAMPDLWDSVVLAQQLEAPDPPDME